MLLDVLQDPFNACFEGEGCPDFDAKLSAMYARTTNAIRAVDPDTLVFLEPNALANSGSRRLIQGFGDANTGLSFHDYCVADRATCTPIVDKVFAQTQTLVARFDGPALLTEFGATNDLAVLTDMADPPIASAWAGRSGTPAAATTRPPPAPGPSRRWCSIRPVRRRVPTC